MKDATSALLRALKAALAPAEVALEEARSRPWASATYTGTSHRLRLAVQGAVDSLADLESREFDLHGHIVASIALVTREDGEGVTRLTIEALTMEDM